jgi:hypothetical protein
VADAQINALPGDVVSSQLCAAPNTRLIALDSSAVAAFAVAGIVAAIGQQLGPPAGSADSIDA